METEHFVHMRSFDEALRHALDASSMTQADLAKGLGVTTRAVSNWASGKRVPSEDLKHQLANALGFEIYYGPARLSGTGDDLLLKIRRIVDDLRDELGVPPGAADETIVDALRRLKGKADGADIEGTVYRAVSRALSDRMHAAGPGRDQSEDGQNPTGRRGRADSDREWTLPQIDELTRRIQQDANRRGEPLTTDELLGLVQLHVRENAPP